MSASEEHAQPSTDPLRSPDATGEGERRGALVVGDLTDVQPLLDATVVAAPAPAAAKPAGDGDGEDGADGGAAPSDGGSAAPAPPPAPRPNTSATK